MKLPGNLPVKTRIPFKLWVLAGAITSFSLMQIATHAQPAIQPHLASAAQLIVLR
jgi:hypothetical protein